MIPDPATAPAVFLQTVPNSGMPLGSRTPEGTHNAREIGTLIPRELPQDAARKPFLFVRENFVSQGMIADVAFLHMDKTNPHAHHHAGPRGSSDLLGSAERSEDSELTGLAETVACIMG